MLLELDSEEYCQALVTRIDDKVKELDQRYRGHLGFSGIGDSDERKLWLSFRWCLPPTFEGRMLRLFDLGNRSGRGAPRWCVGAAPTHGGSSSTPMGAAL